MFSVKFVKNAVLNLRTSEPFWLVKNGIINSYPSLTEDISADVLIVGSGITGSLIAHQCMKDGYDTVVVDRREVCNGSTSATTSMLQYEIDVPLHELIELIGKEGAEKSYWACYEAVDLLGKVSEEVKSDCGFRKKDSLYFAAYKKDVKWMQKELEARKAAGFPVKWLDAEQIDEKFGIKDTWGGILSKQGGSADAFLLAHDVLEYNHKKGLKIFDKTEIRRINYRKSGVLCTTTNGNTIKAKKLIFCNGFESTEIVKDDFVKLLSTFAIVGEQQKKDLKDLNKMLAWNTAEPYLYFRTTDDNRILIGGEDKDFVNPEKRDEMIPKKAKKLERLLQKMIPELDFRTDFAWAGTFGETKDGLPYIGEHPDFPSAYFVLGFGGNGITFSVTGMEMVSKYLKGEPHELEKWFRFRR